MFADEEGARCFDSIRWRSRWIWDRRCDGIELYPASGYRSNSTDCNDTDEDVDPSATEMQWEYDIRTGISTVLILPMPSLGIGMVMRTDMVSSAIMMSCSQPTGYVPSSDIAMTLMPRSLHKRFGLPMHNDGFEQLVYGLSWRKIDRLCRFGNIAMTPLLFAIHQQTRYAMDWTTSYRHRPQCHRCRYMVRRS